jgi:hypothetical protein
VKFTVWTSTLLIGLAMTSCQSDLDIKDIIDQEANLLLTTSSVDSETSFSTNETEEIKVNSEKWNKLLSFAESNMDGWRSSPASYLGNIYVLQDDFRLIYTKGSEGVVISFMDKNAEPKQYVKKIDKGELDFLTD